MDALNDKDIDSEEEDLERLVFGKQSRFIPQQTFGSEDEGCRDGDVSDDEDGDGLFSIDRTGTEGVADDSFSEDRAGETEASEDEEGGSDEEKASDGRRAPAWVDEDDELITVAEAAATMAADPSYRPALPGLARYRTTLEQRFTAVHGAPAWAQLDRKRKLDDEDSEDESEKRVLAKTGHLLARSADRLPRGSIDTKRCGDLLRAAPSRPRTVTALEFHRQSQVALVGGGAGSVSIVQVDGAENPLIQEVALPSGLRPRWAHFTQDGGSLLAGSELSRHVFCYDMMSGRSWQLPLARRLQLRGVPQLVVSPDGEWLAVPGARAGAVHLLSARTRQWVDSLQAGARITALAFSPDGSRLWTHSEQGEVHEWDMTRRCCLHRFQDQGCLAGTSVACAPDGSLLACGSSSGIVNLYSLPATRASAAPQPLKALPQLTTSCSRLAFNSTSELLAMVSDQKENAVKLVHLASRTVFSNFPGWSNDIKRPHALDFSVNSGYMAVGTSTSRALLYRLKQYPNF